MPLESFLNFRNSERMIAKIKLPIPIHLHHNPNKRLRVALVPGTEKRTEEKKCCLLESKWKIKYDLLPHMNLRTRYISLLDSSHAYSAATYQHQKMLIWKFFKMVWTIHASTEASVPSWAIHPARFTMLHPRMMDLTPGMIQTLGQLREVRADKIMATRNDQIGMRWKRRAQAHGLLATNGPTRPVLDRAGTTRDTPAE